MSKPALCSLMPIFLFISWSRQAFTHACIRTHTNIDKRPSSFTFYGYIHPSSPFSQTSLSLSRSLPLALSVSVRGTHTNTEQKGHAHTQTHRHSKESERGGDELTEGERESVKMNLTFLLLLFLPWIFIHPSLTELDLIQPLLPQC